ncbi:unnamed protein product [Pylaiella littoralis]
MHTAVKISPQYASPEVGVSWVYRIMCVFALSSRACVDSILNSHVRPCLPIHVYTSWTLSCRTWRFVGELTRLFGENNFFDIESNTRAHIRS